MPRDERGDGATEPGDPAEAEPSVEVDTGEPIAALRDLAVVARPGFFSRIKRRIGRRLLWADIATFSWSALTATIVEYLALLFNVLQPGDRSVPKGGGDGSDRN